MIDVSFYLRQLIGVEDVRVRELSDKIKRVKQSVEIAKESIIKTKKTEKLKIIQDSWKA